MPAPQVLHPSVFPFVQVTARCCSVRYLPSTRRSHPPPPWMPFSPLVFLFTSANPVLCVFNPPGNGKVRSYCFLCASCSVPLDCSMKCPNQIWPLIFRSLVLRLSFSPSRNYFAGDPFVVPKRLRIWSILHIPNDWR
jgi:hypothetical protein